MNNSIHVHLAPSNADDQSPEESANVTIHDDQGHEDEDDDDNDNEEEEDNEDGDRKEASQSTSDSSSSGGSQGSAFYATPPSSGQSIPSELPSAE